MDGAGGTFSYTFSACFADCGVDIREIVGNRYRAEWAYARAFPAAYACRCAYLAGERSAVAAGACYPYTTLATSFGAEFEKMAGTFCGACTTSSTFIGVDNRQSGVHIDVNGVVVAYLHTVAASEASERASGGSDSDRVHDSATVYTVVIIYLRSCLTAAAAFQNSYFPFHGGRFNSEQSGNLGHAFRSCDRTEKFACFAANAACGKVSATLEAAASAVGAGQHRYDTVDARVFLDVEFLRGYVQNECSRETQES